MFGLLRDVRLRSSVEQLSAGFESLYVILHRFREVSRWHSRRAAPSRLAGILPNLPPAMIPGNAFTGEVQGAGEPIDFEVIRLVDELPRLAQRPSEYR